VPENMSLHEEKYKLRKFILNTLKNHNSKERIEKSRLIAEKIISTREFARATVIMCYAAMSYEVETIEIIEYALKKKKVVCLPRMNVEKKEIIPCEIKKVEKETCMCKYGFREPLQDVPRFEDNSRIDLVLVPGLAFDVCNNRLGRGAGYYDRFLSCLKKDQPRFGMCFDFQVYEHIPHAGHDQKVDRVVSNR
jgi:5-formyltetrahydrofolate cyclo-ligase